jgi:hypothetical protein
MRETRKTRDMTMPYALDAAYRDKISAAVWGAILEAPINDVVEMRVATIQNGECVSALIPSRGTR